MGIKTGDMLKNLPPKEMTTGIDWLGILDSFDPKALSEKYLNECARRNPYEDIILKWIKERKPKSTYWVDGVADFTEE